MALRATLAAVALLALAHTARAVNGGTGCKVREASLGRTLLCCWGVCAVWCMCCSVYVLPPGVRRR